MLLNEQKTCGKCQREVGFGDSSWDDKSKQLLCHDCSGKKLWFITYYNPEGQVSGPIIAAVSKIKPTRAAQMGTETYIPTFTIRQATDKERDEWIEENGYLG